VRWYDPTYDATWLWEGAEPDMPILDRLGELFEPYDLAQGPGEIRMPVLIAQGRYEFGAPPSFWQAHLRKLPRPALVVFDRSSHTPQLEAPERFDEAVLAWIAGLD
jgi:proline iminopeptidase